jgi:hypothetical protein
LAVAALILFVVGGAGYLRGDQERDTGRVYLANSGGGVLFAHAAHGELVGECATCHHDLIRSGGYPSCEACHEDADFADAGLTHAEILDFHSDADLSCTDCHEVASSAEARHCRQCHGNEAGEPEIAAGCLGCHDDAEYSVFADHGEMLATHADAELTCQHCHAVRALTDAYHTQCSDCHLAVAPEEFADAEGRALCARCHLK